MTHVYIAGPMRGYPDFNYPAFNAVAETLQKGDRLGGETITHIYNPAANYGGNTSLEYAAYMAVDLRQVLDSDAIVLLPDWDVSEGARLEVSVARSLGLKFYQAAIVNDGKRDNWVFRGTSANTGEGIEAEARRLVYGDRNKDYGPPRDDFTRIGRVWGAILDLPDIPPELVAVMMSGLKMARQAETPGHRDSRVDVIGYQLCLDRIVSG